MTSLKLHLEKIEDICWDIWFTISAIETIFTNDIVDEYTTKDNLESCLFLYIDELEEIQTVVEQLKIINY